MSEQIDLQQLFRKWRAGDERSGHTMAQLFSDWYYAVSASRLGDREGRRPLERACRRFQEGITEIGDPQTLTDWAHQILIDEIQQCGGRLSGGDQPNALTASRSPTELLRRAAQHMEPEQISLLVHAYDASYPLDALIGESEAAGGYPMALLEARYALKGALRDRLDLKLAEIPSPPKLDLAPLPLYEAGRMTQAREESAFERWMLSDISLCRDLAEFAAFALALRGGALETPAPAAPEVASAPELTPAVRSEAPPAEEGGRGILPKVLAALVVIGLIAAVVLVALKFL